MNRKTSNTLWRRAKAAILFSQATFAMRRNKFGEALEKLDKIYFLYDVSGPSKFVHPEINLVYSLCNYQNSNNDLAEKSCDLALSQFSARDGKMIRQYGIDGVNYLIYYSKFLLNFLDNENDRLRPTDIPEYNLVNFSRVPPRIKARFFFNDLPLP